MSTIHNPTNFIPTDYAVVDYLENRGPEYLQFMGQIGASDLFQEALDQWRQGFARYFGQRIPHNCDHCGARIRYVTVCRHAPTGQYVAIGDICTQNRLDLTVDEFRIKMLRDAASKQASKIANAKRMAKFLSDNLDFSAEYEWVMENGAPNDFVGDVAAKLRKWDLSDNQIRAFVVSCVESRTRAAAREAYDAKPKGDAPAGKATVEGRIASFKSQESMYGWVTKMLVELDSGARVYGTVASSIRGAQKGARVRFSGTFEVSRDDRSFGFFKRPTKASVVPSH